MSVQTLGMIDIMMTLLQCVTLIAAVAAILGKMGKSIGAPNRTQDARLDELERWREGAARRLAEGNRHFDSVDANSTAILNTLLVMLDAMINGDNKDALIEQRNELYKAITPRRGGHKDDL